MLAVANNRVWIGIGSSPLREAGTAAKDPVYARGVIRKEYVAVSVKCDAPW